MTSLIALTNAGTNRWIGMTCNATGQYVVALAVNAGWPGGVWVSSSYGTNWRSVPALTNGAWECAASDSTGQYLVVGVLNGTAIGLYTSSSYGDSWTKIATTTTQGWQSIASSSNGRYLIASGNAIQRSSSYGANWTLVSATASTSVASDSTGQYVAYAAGTTVYTSSSYGINWTTTTAGTAGRLASDSTGQYLVVAASGVIKTSNNYGVTWTNQTATTPVNIATIGWQYVVSDSTGAKLAALGAANDKIYISDNYGVNWSALSSTTGNWYLGLACNSTRQNIYASALYGNVYGYISYIAPPDPTITPAATQNVTMSITTNTASVTATSNSPGALSYSLSTSGATTFGNASITTSSNTGSTFVGGNLLVALGKGNNTIAYSTDGTVWTGLGTTIFSNYGGALAWNGTIWVAIGLGTFGIAHSSDGTTWTGVAGSSSIFGGYGGRGIAWNGTLWVAVGNSPLGGFSSIIYSSGGTTWTSAAGSSMFGNSGWGIAWNGTLWVAVGTINNAIAYSSNGTTWTGLGTGILSGGRGVAWNGTLWVAVGEGSNGIAYSSNGTNWIGITGGPIFSTVGYGVAWNGTLWVAVGQGTNSIAYSSDGTTWTGVTGSTTIFGTYGRSVTWNGTLWVAVGKGTISIAYSSDGTTWTGVTGSTTIFGSEYGRAVASNITYSSRIFYNGTVSITGPGTINTYVTQTAESGYAALTTPTLAGTINVLSVPTIRPANTQTVNYPATTSATVTAISNSSGALTYSLQAGFPAGTSINSTTGVITIGSAGTINVLATQAASGNFTAVTTPVTVGTINVLGAPTITPATTRTIAYRQVNKVTVTPTSNSSGAFTYSLQTNTATFSGFAVIDPVSGIVTLGGIGTINVFVTQAATNVYSAVTTPVPAGTITVNYIAIPCFKEDTHILTIDGYRLIQDLRKGDLVKTLNHGYVGINTIGHQSIYNEKDKMIFDKIFKCTNENYPEIFEDLYITGLHAVLVDSLTDEQQTQIKGIYNDSVFITDDKYRLPVCYDERAKPYESKDVEKVVIYHLALNHEDENLNYGIYANGLLVETTSIRLMKESGLIMVE